MTQSCVAVLIKGAAINCRLRLVLSHLWASEIVKQYRTLHWRTHILEIYVRCLVSGKVQGVFFRASARHQAQSLGITGYAKNLPDGRVEILACGEPKTISQFKSWLAKGPAGAQVTSVSCEAAPEQVIDGFRTY